MYVRIYIGCMCVYIWGVCAYIYGVYVRMHICGMPKDVCMCMYVVYVCVCMWCRCVSIHVVYTCASSNQCAQKRLTLQQASNECVAKPFIHPRKSVVYKLTRALYTHAQDPVYIFQNKINDTIYTYIHICMHMYIYI